MSEFEADRFVIGAVGEPGNRTFVVQASSSGQAGVTLKLEKQQALALAKRLIEFLDDLAGDLGPDPVEAPPDARIGEPFGVDFVVGMIGFEHDAEADRIVVEFTSVEAEPDAVADDEVVRIRLTRTRARSAANAALDVVEAGRPPCELCGRPKGPDHICVRTNGKVH